MDVPKEVRETVPPWMKETLLGAPEGSIRQYRDGNMHVREYADRYSVHYDRFDPRSAPIRHLLFDAQEVAAGLAYAAVAGLAAARGPGGPGRALAAAAAAGCAGYEAARRLKGRP
ncbi:MAG: hypothetical protein MPJ06_00260 [Nitrosopumilus sp.]|nr:hypothetical protein [Nitrosopumilus sp.]MDA7942431.1 hypothetical protein [Nitrosopumilus sp.]